MEYCQKRSTVPTTLLCLSLLTLHPHPATPAALHPAPNPNPLFQPSSSTNLTTFATIFNTTANIDTPAGQFHCAGDKPWTASYKPSDCVFAMNGLARQAAIHGDVAFSWPAIAVRGRLKYEAVETPIRYQWRSCTLAIAMLADAGTLPEGPPPPYAQWERASFLAVYETVRELFQVCEIGRGKLGWANVSPPDLFVGGQLGVFFWGTGSEKDRSVPRG